MADSTNSLKEAAGGRDQLTAGRVTRKWDLKISGVVLKPFFQEGKRLPREDREVASGIVNRGRTRSARLTQGGNRG